MARYEAYNPELIGLEAEAGSVDALFELGMRYSIGNDVEFDLIAAHKWFSIAAAKGNKLAREYRTEISREMSRNDLRVAQREARNWLRSH